MNKTEQQLQQQQYEQALEKLQRLLALVEEITRLEAD